MGIQDMSPKQPVVEALLTENAHSRILMIISEQLCKVQPGGVGLVFIRGTRPIQNRPRGHRSAAYRTYRLCAWAR